MRLLHGSIAEAGIVHPQHGGHLVGNGAGNGALQENRGKDKWLT